jgi:uncharacterized membrane protein YciS (DUF1049 family)
MVGYYSREMPTLRKIRSLALIFAFGLGCAAIMFLTFYLSGKAGDCKPQEIDGQCGMSTFVGFLFGAIAGAVIGVWGIVVGALRLKRKQWPFQGDI